MKSGKRKISTLTVDELRAIIRDEVVNSIEAEKEYRSGRLGRNTSTDYFSEGRKGK